MKHPGGGAETCDSLALQRQRAVAMLAADAPGLQLGQGAGQGGGKPRGPGRIGTGGGHVRDRRAIDSVHCARRPLDLWLTGARGADGLGGGLREPSTPRRKISYAKVHAAGYGPISVAGITAIPSGRR